MRLKCARSALTSFVVTFDVLGLSLVSLIGNTWFPLSWFPGLWMKQELSHSVPFYRRKSTDLTVRLIKEVSALQIYNVATEGRNGRPVNIVSIREMTCHTCQPCARPY